MGTKVTGTSGIKPLSQSATKIMPPCSESTWLIDDERLFLAGGDGVLRVFDDLPLAGFAAEEQLDGGIGEGGEAALAAGVAPVGCGSVNRQVRVADNAEALPVQFGCQLVCDLG